MAGAAVPFASAPSPTSPNSPAWIKGAYGFNQISADGTGQTIAIVDAYNDPTIASDLATFSTQFNLPQLDGRAGDGTLTVINQSGASSPLPATDAGWSQEISLDVEWAHAIAPKANILLVEANSSSLDDLLPAVRTAATHTGGPTEVSMSWGASEFSGESAYDSYFASPGVVFVASSGDNGGGARFGRWFVSPSVEWPAASNNVVSVGGASLTVNTTTTGGATTFSYQGETAWSGSGGGISRYEPAGSYQQTAINATRREVPDVALDANPSTGVLVYDSTPYDNQSGWLQFGGTSIAAPMWAGFFALVNQTHLPDGQALNSSNPQEALSLLYNNAYTEYSGAPSSVYHDITSGSNNVSSAGPGYDLVTGLGTPIANNLYTYFTTGVIPANVTSVSTSPALLALTSSRRSSRTENAMAPRSGPLLSSTTSLPEIQSRQTIAAPPRVAPQTIIRTLPPQMIALKLRMRPLDFWIV